jgi:ADP-dependent NAD(P)H-hydrate dehydratase / NAD(P)H-hydrate epimerase
MIRVATASEMQGLDRRATAECGIPSLLLMENAGAETAREILAAFPEVHRCRVVVLCGRGNNGGDGFVIARRLLGRGISVHTLLLARREDVRGDARINLEILEKLGAAPVEIGAGGDLSSVQESIGSSDLVVDALLGTGAQGPARGLTAETIECVNRSGRPVVSVDIPSGLGADQPESPGPAIRATLTVTFALPKRSLLLFPAAAHAGTVRVVDIGIPRALWAGAPVDVALLEPADVMPAFPVRDPGAHKGTFGHVLVIAGSAGKTGAAALAGLGAMRMGAGLVTLAVPTSVHEILEIKLTEAMTVAVPETEARTVAREALDVLLSLAEGKDAVAIGPGLGTHPSTQALVRELVARLRLPLVMDADAINAFAGMGEALRRAGGALVLTPHPGECSRLLGVPRAEVLRDRIPIVQKAVVDLQLTLVLKMARTLVGHPSEGVAIVPTGNPGMATGGTGDVLTGLIAGMLGRGVAPPLAARAGAYVHGLAGDIAAERLGPEPLLAGDLLDCVPEAIRRVKSRDQSGNLALGRFGDQEK